MELIQIIYSVLIYGGASLFVVVIFSFVISKVRGDNSKDSKLLHAELTPQYLQSAQYNYYKIINKNSAPIIQNQSEQTSLRKFSSQTQPQIFQIDRDNQREVKIFRKSTFHTRPDLSIDKVDRVQKNNTRYTIVNEQINNSKSRVMNFYL